MAIVSTPKDITPERFYKQWLRLGTAQATVSHFERSVIEFSIRAGGLTRVRFEQSFKDGEFYGSGEKWPERTSRWGRQRTHPILIDSGLLKSKMNNFDRDIERVTHKPAPGRKSEFRRFCSYSIIANPESVKQPGHRGVRKSGPTTYAAVHNAPASFGFWTNQYHKSRPVQRQFMGFNKRIDDEVTQYYSEIFNGIPLPSE